MDIVEGLISVVTLIMHWRIVICLAISTLAAFAFVQVLPWFSGLQGVVIAALELVPGSIWHSKHETNSQLQGVKITSKFVARLTAFFAGVVWGGASSTSPQSALAGSVVLVLSLLTWYYYQVVAMRRSSHRRVVGCSAIAVATYILTVVLN